MRRMIQFQVCALLILFFCLQASIAAQANPPDADSTSMVPAATFSDFECTGFISATPESDAIRLYNGADNDLFETLHTFTPGDLVYLRNSGGAPFHAGEAFSIIRPDRGGKIDTQWRPSGIENQIEPFASNYKRQTQSISSLGYPYDNTGLVRVVRVTPQGAIAKVEFACAAINPQDIAVPYIPQAIPQYAPDQAFDPWAPPDGKLQGVIVGAGHAATFLAKGGIAFLDIGRDKGVEPGQRYRIYSIFRHNVLMGLDNHKQALDTPRESIGEIVILHVQGKASEGIVVTSLREIAVGDGVELE